MIDVASHSCKSQSSCDPEEQTGKQTHVHSRDDEEMKRACTLKTETLRFIQSRAIAEEHCVQHSGVVRA